MAKVTYDDMFDLVKEIERGAKDKSRTLNSVTNLTVRNMLASEASMAIKSGVTASVLGASVATGTLIGSVGGAGTGVVTSSLTTLGVAAFSATAGGATGAAAGSVIPVVGTVIGAAVGVATGLFVGSRIEKKNNEKKESLHQEVIKKQNTIIRDLEKELNELKQKYGEKVEQNERYKYIISLLMANEELKQFA